MPHTTLSFLKSSVESSAKVAHLLVPALASALCTAALEAYSLSSMPRKVVSRARALSVESLLQNLKMLLPGAALLPLTLPHRS